MANTFRKVYKKTGNSGTSSDYQLVGNIGVNGVELDIMKGASSSVDGELGLVPKPTKGQENSLLTGAGTFQDIDTVLNSSEKISSFLNPELLLDTGYITNTTANYTINFTDYKYLLLVARRYSSPIQTQLIPLSMFKEWIEGGPFRVIFYLYIGSDSVNTIQLEMNSGNKITITCSTTSGNYVVNIYGVWKE